MHDTSTVPRTLELIPILDDARRIRCHNYLCTGLVDGVDPMREDLFSHLWMDHGINSSPSSKKGNFVPVAEFDDGCDFLG